MTDAAKQEELNYLLLKKKSSDVDWYDFIDKAAEFTGFFDAELQKEYTQDSAIAKKFWKCIDTIKLADLLEVDLVTEKIDPLVVISRTEFDFVYFSVVHRQSLLHMGCWLCMPRVEADKPHIMCCLLYATRVQKLSEWQIYANDENNKSKEWDKFLNLDGSLEFP